MQIEFQTSVGRKRRNNQDTVGVYYNQEGITLAIVADGMGGHQAGDTASYLAVTGLGNVWEETMLTQKAEITDWLVEHIKEENFKIHEKGSQDPEMYGMGTTIVATVLLGSEILLAHVGDSRAYLICQGEIKQLTEDHSLVNELVKSGEITAEMAEVHPKRNILLRSIGVPGDVEVDLSWLNISTGDYMLLCSDGLTNMLSDSEILAIVSSELALEDKVNQLIEKANEAGGIDNITALLIEFSDELWEVKI